MDIEDSIIAGPARQLQLLNEGAITSRQLTEATLDASHRVNTQVNAFVAIDDHEALAAADDADKRRANKDAAPLLGIPIAIKDEFDMAGKVTGWGSRSTTTSATADAEIVAAIRAAGMIAIGKTTLPELAIFGFTESAAHGITGNPHNLAHTSGGSSGGSAAAVAGGGVGIALASDGAGSIRIPAACCGLVGFKPTGGAMPSSGNWQGLSTPGCLTSRISDTALFLDAIGDFDTSLTQAAATDPRPLRIGVSLQPFPMSVPLPLDPRVAAAVRAAAESLRVFGHDVRDVKIDFGMSAQAMSARYLAGIHDVANGVDEPRLLEKRTRQIALLGKPITAKMVTRARAAGQRFGAELLAGLDVDILLTPTMSGPAVPVGRWAGKSGLRTVLSMGRFYAYTPAWNHTGQPAVSMPAGRTDGNLPLAVQFIAAPGDDARLMAVAGQYERVR